MKAAPPQTKQTTPQSEEVPTPTTPEDNVKPVLLAVGFDSSYNETRGKTIGALLVGHIGKLVKLAGGMLNTHSKYGDCRIELLAAHAGASGLRREAIQEIMGCVACDDAIRIIQENGFREETLDSLIQKIWFYLSHRIGAMEIGTILFSKEYGMLSKTENAELLLKNIKNQILG